jgi:hypothetical protein
MDQTPDREKMEDQMKKMIAILFVLISILGCTPVLNENMNVDLKKLKVGDTVYVCGCPDMCCNSISKSPGGYCGCNFPLKQATVSKIQNGLIHVNVSGREKVFYSN